MYVCVCVFMYVYVCVFTCVYICVCGFSAFQSILPHVQLLWELVLVGEVSAPGAFFI